VRHDQHGGDQADARGLGRDPGHADDLLVALERRILVELAGFGIGIAWHLGVGQHDMVGQRQVVEAHGLAFAGDPRHVGDRR
jgi:hypothetical protein